MKVLLDSRGTGKTTQLILNSHLTGAYIVCRNESDVKHIIQESKKLNLDIPYPFTYKEFMDKRYYGRNIPGFLIDDADILLQSLTNVPIMMVTMSDNNPNPYLSDVYKKKIEQIQEVRNENQ